MDHNDVKDESVMDEDEHVLVEEPEILTRQQRRGKALKVGKRFAKRVGKNKKGIPRNERRKVSFNVVKKQIKDGER